MSPGTYVIESVEGIDISVTIPGGAEGWEGGGFNFLGRPPFTDAPGGVMLAFNDVRYVLENRCETNSGAIDPGPGVDELAAAFATVPRAEIDGPDDVRIGGYSGQHVELQIDDDLSECEVEAVGLYYIGPVQRVVGAGEHVDLYVLDVDGERLVVEALYLPDASPADVEMLEEIVDSIELRPAD